jgi:hypothetical protein
MLGIEKLLGHDDEMGNDEGEPRGPKPGHGADIHQLSGENDFDGLPGDALPPTKITHRNEQQS